ncbi:MAG: FtsH protease activity modulator HflK [Alphaproteobacteria bacterium]|nr:FtsH protease activity modulator HflK [Alphaproteobacteria bacterium]
MAQDTETDTIQQPLASSPGGSQNHGPWGPRTHKPDGFNHGHGNGPAPDRDRDEQPPNPGQDNFNDLVNSLYEQVRRRFAGGGGGGAAAFPVKWILLAVVAIWLASGLYRVNPGEQGVVLRFGQWINQDNLAAEGLHWHLPWPIETVITPQVEEVRQIDIGFRGSAANNVSEESLMLTGDQNIIDIDFTVQWRIRDAGKYLFNIRDPDATIKIAAESAMREIIGRTGIQRALTEGRAEIASRARDALQTILDEYSSGILVSQVTLQEAQPPEPVIDAFEEVQRARQDLERLRNQADAYSNKVIPEARGDAQRVLQEAEGYRARVIAEGQGEADRFNLVYDAYTENPRVTSRRLYLEAIEGVLSRSDKVILGGDGNVLPILPLRQGQTPPLPVQP